MIIQDEAKKTPLLTEYPHVNIILRETSFRSYGKSDPNYNFEYYECKDLDNYLTGKGCNDEVEFKMNMKKFLSSQTDSITLNKYMITDFRFY